MVGLTKTYVAATNRLKHLLINKNDGVTTALWVVVMLVLSACSSSVKNTSKLEAERDSVAVMKSYQVTTLISDSGIIRYRIKAPMWKVYDKADTPYWEFPDGIYLEKFNLNLEADATIEADYAHYDEPAQRWTLQGNVKAINLEGEQFETPLLFWEQKSESVYSDSSIVITRESSIIHGVGFRSNQEMTQYTILRPTGVFPIKE